jgi:bacteriorhodopsin
VLSLSLNQYELVSNVFSFTMAAMGAASFFFFVQRGQLAPRYRMVATLAGVVTVVACYNYFRLFQGWTEAYTVSHGIVTATGRGFDEAYRYADWLFTVPVLLVNLVLVIDLPRRQAQVRGFVLALQAVEMILLGYPGQISNDPTTRWLWWGASMVPFGIIVYQLYVTLADAVRNQPEGARHLVVLARFMTVLIWCFYPAIYLLPMLGVTGATSFVLTQAGYAAADLSAKALYGVMLYMIAARKSQADLEAPAVGATATDRAVAGLRAKVAAY